MLALVASAAIDAGGMVLFDVAAAVHGDHSAFAKTRIHRCGERVRVMMAEEIRLCVRESLAPQEFLAQEMRLETLAAAAQPFDEVREQHLRALAALVAPTRKTALELLVPGFADKIFFGEETPEQRQAFDIGAFMRSHAEHRVDGEIG